MRSSKERAVLIALVAAVMIGAVADAAYALKPHNRKGWLVGVSLGVGPGKVTVLDPAADEVEYYNTDWQEGMTPGFRFGWIFIPNRLMLSFENKQWLNEQAAPGALAVEDEIIKLRTNAQHYSFALTWFPGSITGPTGGIYLKGGVGWANARFTVLQALDEPSEHGDTFEEEFLNDDAGLAMFGEMGYEFRIFSPFAAGVGVSYNYLDLPDGLVFKDTKTLAVGLTMNWYF